MLPRTYRVRLRFLLGFSAFSAGLAHQYVSVPVEYLKPIQPRRANSRTLVLGGGSKGKVVIPKDRGGGQLLVRSDIDNTLEEVANKLLCIWEDPDMPFES